jgi:hypothetical protein
MRNFLALVALACVPSLTAAQSVADAAVIVAPHFTQYDIGTGAAKRSISQMAFPVVVLIPFSDRVSVDISTAFANSQSEAGGNTSTISGITDTQIRGNLMFGSDNLVFTVGVNLPTGQYTVPADQQEAAGQIGNDFLNYPISAMGNGFAGTGGVAYARPMGNWNVGMGASFRKSSEFSAFEVQSSDFRFTPADEYRLRLGADRPVGDGQVSFGVSYSAFGQDIADSTTYSTGDRLTATGMWMFPVGAADVYLSGWNLYRMPGQQLGGDAPAENVASLNAAASFELGSILLQPNLEGRFWQIDGARAGQITNAGLRLRLGAGGFSFFPSAGYTIGNLYDITNGAATDVTGVRGSLTIRWN